MKFKVGDRVRITGSTKRQWKKNDLHLIPILYGVLIIEKIGGECPDDTTYHVRCLGSTDRFRVYGSTLEKAE